LVFKGGVGIVGITLSKWGGCKKVDMCDLNRQVVGNMSNNCQRNGINSIKSKYQWLYEIYLEAWFRLCYRYLESGCETPYHFESLEESA